MRDPQVGDVVFCYTTFRPRPRPNSCVHDQRTAPPAFDQRHALVVIKAVPATEPWKVISADRTHDVQVLLPNGQLGYIFSDHLDKWEEDETDA